MPKAKSSGKASGKTEERQESGKPLPWCTPLTQTGKDTKTQETTLPGYRGETPVITPTVLHVSDKWDFAKWGGDSSRPDRPSPGLPLIKHKRECPAGTPSFLSVWCSRTSQPTAAGHPRASRRPDGHRKARRRTIPRRRSAAPSRQGKRPFVGCGFAAKPARRSLPRPAQTGSGFPSAGSSRSRSAARGKRQQSGRRTHAAALRPEANRQRAAPAMLAAPAPQPTHNRRAAAGRAFPLGRSCGPATVLAGHALAQRPPPLSSLHDPRHRSCTGSRLLAALPALHALRHCSGKAAAAGSCPELRNETESSTAPGPNSAHNAASDIRNFKQLPCGYAALV